MTALQRTNNSSPQCWKLSAFLAYIRGIGKHIVISEVARRNTPETSMETAIISCNPRGDRPYDAHVVSIQILNTLCRAHPSVCGFSANLRRLFLKLGKSYGFSRANCRLPLITIFVCISLTVDGSQRASLSIPPAATLSPCLWSLKDLTISPGSWRRLFIAMQAEHSFHLVRQLLNFTVLAFSSFSLRKLE